MQNGAELYEFYQIRFDKDAEKIIIDFQSNDIGILVNIGDKKPDIKNNDFSFFSKRNDSIFIIDKKDINNCTTLKNMHITLTIYSNVTNSLNEIPYSFIVRLSKKTNDIYKINSEHKASYKTNKLEDNKYRCYIL